MIDFSDSFYNEIDFRKYLKETSLPEAKVVRLYLTGSDLKNINEQIETFKNIGLYGIRMCFANTNIIYKLIYYINVTFTQSTIYMCVS